MRTETAVRLAIVLAGIVVLDVLCRTHVISPLVLLPPSTIAAALASLLLSGEANDALMHTASTIGIAFVISVVLGFLIGAAIHASPRMRRACDPIIASYYAIPIFVFYPLLVAIFGLTNWPLIFIGVGFAFVAMVIATLNGLDRIPRVHFKLARVMRMSRLERLRLILLPSAAPCLFTGVKLSLAYSFIGVLAGEFILSSTGIGHSIAYAYENFDMRTMYAMMLLVLLLAVIINAALHGWEARLMRRRVRT